MNTVIHCLVSWILAEFCLLLALLATACMAFGNFVVAWQSFSAQGFEPTPLSETPFLGLVAEAVGLGSVTVAAMYALVLTLGMNAIVIITLKLLGRGIQECFDYRQVSRSSDPAMRARKADCLDMLLKTGCWLTLLLLLTFLTVRFDVAQFELRLNTLYLNVTDPGEMLDWSATGAERLGRFLGPFVSVAGWGYVGLIVGVAMTMEYAFMRTGERWLVLGNAVRQAIDRGRNRELREASAPVLATVEGPQLAAEAPNGANGAAERPVKTLVAGGIATGSITTPTRPAERVAGPPASVESPITVPPQVEPEVEVIVGPGESRRVAVTEIDAHPEEFVRDGSGRVWFARPYYDQVMGRETQGERQP